MQRYKMAPYVIAFVMFVIGGCGLVYEYALGFLGNNLIGSSHEQIYMVIGIMMFAMGVGAYLQAYLFKTKLVDKFLLIELGLALLGATSVLVIYTAYAYSVNYELILWGFAFTMGAFIGAEIPLIMRINKEHGNLVPQLNVIMGVDYVGSLLGAIVFVYLMLPHFSITTIVLTLGLVNLLAAVLAFGYFFRLVHKQKTIAFCGWLVTVIIILSGTYSKPIMGSLQQRCFADPIVLTTTSPYQHLVVTESAQGDTRLYINGKLQFSSIDEHVYHEMLVHVPMQVVNDRQNVLILGGGDGMALREVLKYPDVQTVTLVDLDPEMTRLFATEPRLRQLNDYAFQDARVDHLTGSGIEPGEPAVAVGTSHLSASTRNHTEYPLADVNIINIDADQFIRSINGVYDVIIIDFPDPSMLELAKLYSVDFYRQLRTRLAPGGVFSVQSTSPHYAQKAFVCIGLSIHAAGFKTLPYQEMIPSFQGPWGWHLGWNDNRSANEILDRLSEASLEVPTEYVTSDVLISSFVFGKGILNTDNIRINTKMQPIIVSYYQKGWNR